MGWLILAVVLLFVILFASVAYKIKKSQRDAQAFCDRVQLKEDIKTVIARAGNDQAIPRRETEEDGTEHYAFEFPGFIHSYTSCDLAVKANKVVSKKVIMHTD